jgi:hypothetical protein
VTFDFKETCDEALASAIFGGGRVLFERGLRRGEE